MIQIIVDKKRILAKENQTLLEAAREAGIDIPALCYHPDLEVKASCRLCLVEIKGEKGLQTACSVKVRAGMEVITDSKDIKRARTINLSMIFNRQPELVEFARKYKIKIIKLSPRKEEYPKYNFGPAVLFDTAKCIDCRNCLETCQKQEVSFFDFVEKETFHPVLPTRDKKRDCVYCGQCVVHCPVGSLVAVSDIANVEKALKNKNKIKVAQFAPSIRTSIGEEFGLPAGAIVTGQLAGAIKKLGFDKVLDTSVGADFTTFEEAQEFVNKLKNKKTPCLSSCCSAWVKFLEFNYPEFIPHIATTRSPQMILGGLIKTFWAEKEKINPKKIVVVSIMPCVAKKYESQRKELEIKGMKPVDYVLTTRELAKLLKKKKIDLGRIKPEKPADPLGIPSGAGVIYGASGGVAESVLRTAYNIMVKGKTPKFEFKAVRGQAEIKKAVLAINGRTIKMVVVNGLGSAKKILEELKKNPTAYDGVEVMACPGGCIGGGGQPLPADAKIRKARASALYTIDARNKIRAAHQNPIVKKVYRDYLTSKEKVRLICHTKYFHKKREVKLN